MVQRGGRIERDARLAEQNELLVQRLLQGYLQQVARRRDQRVLAPLNLHPTVRDASGLLS